MKTLAKICLIGLVSLTLALPTLAGEDETTIVIENDGKLRIIGEDADGGWLGVTLSPLDEEMAEEAGLRKTEGALVQSVFDDTPAEEAGLEAGDIIVEFDGKKIKDVGTLVSMVQDREAGDEVKIKARRDGKRKSFNVTLGERERSFTIQSDMLHGGGPNRFFMKQMDGCRPHSGHSLFPGKQAWTFSSDCMPGRARLGVEIRDLEGELAGYFPGTDDGALILSVIDDSVAEEAGLEAGDVIVKLGDERIDNADDLREAVAEVAGEGEVKLVYYRQGKQRDSDVEIEPGGVDIAAGHLSRIFEEGDGKFYKVLDRLQEEDWSEKLEQVEERLLELEERLKEKFGDQD